MRRRALDVRWPTARDGMVRSAGRLRTDRRGPRPAVVPAAHALVSPARTPPRRPYAARRGGNCYIAGMTSGMTNGILPGRWVLSELWGVLSVLVERWDRRGGVLVMRKSRVRIP